MKTQKRKYGKRFSIIGFHVKGDICKQELTKIISELLQWLENNADCIEVQNILFSFRWVQWVASGKEWFGVNGAMW